MSERMPKIYLYINVLGGGGAERVIANLANTLAEDGCETTLITSFPVDKEYSIDKKVRRLLLEDHEFRQSRLKRNVTRISKLRKICKEEKPDILISFMEEPNFRAILATRGLPVSVVEAQANGLHCLLSDVITHDVDLTDQVKYLALANKKVWLCEVANLQRKHRIAATAENMAKLQPFDATVVAKQLQGFYLEQDERVRK